MIKPNTGPELPQAASVTDENLRRFLGYHLKRAFNVISSDLARALEPFGLRMITYSALVLIVENPGLRQSQLADALDIERPNLVVIIDELEDRELIVRDRVPSDRRAYALRATLAGRRLCEKAIASNQTAENALLAMVGDADRAAVMRVLDSIARIGGRAR
jgi:DNA-binding MarR family transcriptional regulator